MATFGGIMGVPYGIHDHVCAENKRLKAWIADLQSGMFVNCIYCGHCYGPKETTPVSMADALKEHIEKCSEHPMSKLKEENRRLLSRLVAVDNRACMGQTPSTSFACFICPCLEGCQRMAGSEECGKARDSVSTEVAQAAVFTKYHTQTESGDLLLAASRPFDPAIDKCRNCGESDPSAGCGCPNCGFRMD